MLKSRSILDNHDHVYERMSQDINIASAGALLLGCTIMNAVYCLCTPCTFVLYYIEYKFLLLITCAGVVGASGSAHCAAVH